MIPVLIWSQGFITTSTYLIFKADMNEQLADLQLEDHLGLGQSSGPV